MLSTDPSPEVLTRRQRQVVALLAHGLSVAEAATLLHRAFSTVDSHRQAAHQVLRVHGRASLVRWAVRSGIDQCTPVDLPRRIAERSRGVPAWAELLRD